MMESLQSRAAFSTVSLNVYNFRLANRVQFTGKLWASCQRG